MAVKKQKEPMVIEPFIPIKLKKIGERHGDKIGDEFKPPNQEPKPKKISEPNPKKVALKSTKAKKTKTPRKRKPRKPSRKTIEKRTEYSEKFKIELRENATKAELLFKSNLDLYEIEYVFQKEIITRKSFIVADFYIPELNLMVELDGGYHYNKEQREKDRVKDIEYRSRGFKVLRMQNERVSTFDFLELKESVVNKKPTPYLRRNIY
ncbi:MAG: endonuclease domain-containing protein [Candidatus Doudnabacteria bacterium]